MSQPQQMNMGGMGGPVGGALPQQNNQQQQQNAGNAGTPNGGAVPANDPLDTVKRLNTYIYDYFLRNQHYDIARAMHQSSTMEIFTQPKQSPNQRQNQPNGNDDNDADRPKDLPDPAFQNTEGPFLQDWWFQFWDIYHSRRNQGSKQSTLGYITAQRNGQKQRANLMGGMDPATMQNMRNMNMMSNGMMQNDLKKAAMQNAGNINPQQLAQMQRMRQVQQGQQQMMPGQQMERSNSQMEMNGPRSGSPGSGDAPSPKRQRLDGNVQQMGPRPGQQGQMPNTQVGLHNPSLDPAAANQTRELLARSGIDPNLMPPDQFHQIAMQPTDAQQKSAEIYSHQMQQSAMNAMNQAKSNMNKGMPPNVSAAMGPAGAQGSPLSQAGIDPSLEYGPNGAMRPGIIPGAAVAAAGAPGGPNSGNHALQDYQMQLMLLEQQNKKRLLMARQEQDSMTHPGMQTGPNGQFAPTMSPQGSRAGGPSPNPNEMARGTPKMQPGASPNGQMQGRASPAPGFDPSQGIPPNMRNQMVVGPNGTMMPRSHPQFAGGHQGHQGLTQGTLEQFNRQMMPTNGTFPGQPMPPNMMPGAPPMPGQQQQQPGQGPPNMTPRQGNQAMPPPPAPQPNATGGTQPSSPAAAPAPPTPNQTNKAKPGTKKDTKNNKKSANKKGGQTGATPASESEQPPTPTPATPITPMNQNSFQKQQIAPNGGMPNGAQQQQQQQQQHQGQNQQPNQGGNGMPPQAPDMNGPFGGSGNLVGDDSYGGGMNLDYAELGPGGGGGDVLDNFDFDSFLDTNVMESGMAFDNFNFDTGLEAGGDGMGGP